MVSTSASDGPVIGVDVGGTKVAAGLVDPGGAILFQTRNPMVANGGPENGLAAVAAAIDAVFAGSAGTPGETIHGIGICAPGPLDPATGVVLNPPNLPCWRDFPLADEVAQRYRAPVRVDNDANAAGLAEAMWGAGQGYNNIFYFTIGTGIGTAIVLNRHIFHGRTGAAGEGGHLSIDYKGPMCACGKRGCIEAFASGPSIARRARAKIEAGRASGLLGLAGGKADLITGKMIGQMYAAGDALAGEILLETVELLSFWLGNIIDLLEPDVMIMGGGVASMLTPFLGEISDRLTRCCLNSRSGEIPLVAAHYGEDAGVVGGAALCFAAGKGAGPGKTEDPSPR
ncbi:MAG: ROK family protein [Candidatus Sulfotelmatobacter sp.]